MPAGNLSSYLNPIKVVMIDSVVVMEVDNAVI
jgi:hypothetical protein